MTVTPKPTLFDRLASVKKAVVTAAGLVAVIGTYLATADVSTPLAVAVTVVGVVTVVGTYFARNAPPVPPNSF